MHFIIAQTLLKYYAADEKVQESIASHICEATDIIKEQVVHRQSFRKLLFDCAQSAAESGARPTAANFYASCFALLQDDPWDDAKPDVYYDETLALYTRAAECYHYMSRYDEAFNLLSKFGNAIIDGPVCGTPAPRPRRADEFLARENNARMHHHKLQNLEFPQR